jgi:hypothetical protein
MTTPSRTSNGSRPRRTSDRPLSESVERQINENLKRLYQEAAEEPLPDHLLQLLDKLKKQGEPQ